MFRVYNHWSNLPEWCYCSRPWAKLTGVLLSILILSVPVFGQEEEVHGTGYVPSPFSKQLRAESQAKHGKRLMAMQELDLPEKFETPFQIPQQNQGSCGSCWDVSGCISVSGAFIAAGMAKGDGSFIIAPDAVMWCYRNGGCNGDDASTVMQIMEKDGLPIEADFGPYRATSRGNCNKTAKRYGGKGSGFTWGYADADGNGVADYGEIKAVILAHGACVITVNAGGLVNGEKVSTSRGGGTNHQIVCVGWDDTKVGDGYSGALLCKNQWGNWGFKHTPPKATEEQFGYTWLGNLSNGHIAASGSSEVLWCRVENPNPPTPPTPPGPDFTPPLRLIEGEALKPVGNAGGYLTIASAETAGQAIADKDQDLVMIMDKAFKQIKILHPNLPPVPPVPPLPPPTPATVTFTIPAYSFTVPSSWSSRTVTIPAQTITAPISQSQADCPDCVPVVRPMAPVRQAAPAVRTSTTSTTRSRTATQSVQGNCADGSCSTMERRGLFRRRN